MRLSRPDIRIVTGGIAFYALLSVFPIVYLTLTLLFALLPDSLSSDLANTIDQILLSAVTPLTEADLDTIRKATPHGLTLRAILTLLFIFYTASSAAKAAMTGIRMVAESQRRTKIINFHGTSMIMTTLLILLVWLLGAFQLLLTFVGASTNYVSMEVAADLSALADRLWVSKFGAAFAVFYLIIGFSLHRSSASARAKAMGAAAGAAAWVGVTWAYSVYLSFSVLDTFYGALASVILGLIWLTASVSSLLLGAALAVEWGRLIAQDKADDT